MDCIFCKILKNEIPCSKVYEDDYVLAFNDINPMAKVHILFIPKTHVASASEITSENSLYVAKIFEAIAKVAKDMNLEDGFRVATNCGKHACQSVGHLHFHLVGGEQLEAKMG